MTPEQILVKAAREMVEAAQAPYVTRAHVAPYADALHDALVGFDKRAKFIVRFGDKERSVPGYIFGPFGISDTSSGSRRRWHLTHLNTGFALPGVFEKKAQAIAYANELTPLLPWDVVTVDNSAEYATPDTSKQIRDAARRHGGHVL